MSSYHVEFIEPDTYLTSYPRGYDRAPLARTHVARTVSHLEALRAWLDTNESEAIFYEGEPWERRAFPWPWSWEEVRAHVPHTFDVFQMHVTYDPCATPEVRMHRRANERSVSCYLITRGHAEKLMRLYRVGQQYDLTRVYPRACAEEVIYDAGVVFTMPLVSSRARSDTQDASTQEESAQDESTQDASTQDITQDESTQDFTQDKFIHTTQCSDTNTRDSTHKTSETHDLIELVWARIGDVHDPYDLF